MQKYESEILDNIDMSSNSVACLCEIVGTRNLDDVPNEITIAIAAVNKQDDLYYLNSILVSAGWNKNDDVFEVADLWTAKDTPVNKPFNYMHNDSDIIGHMIASSAFAEDGTEVVDIPLPERIDLVTSAVIYKTWSDPEQKLRVMGLIDQIDRGELAVSMECVFRNFDYALISPTGENKILARSEDSAFLTKHLRAYGGSGEYEGYKIGRLLRDLYFSGKGLVDKPANPRSVILPKDVNPFALTADMILTAMEVAMPEINELESAKASVASLSVEVESHKASVASLEGKVADLEQTIATITQEKMALSQELQTMVANLKAVTRKTELMNAGANEAKATELAAQFAQATDEMFALVVALIVPETSKVEDAVVAETEALDEVVVETPVMAIEDSTSDKISVASAWLRDSVLKSTKTIKKG